MTWASLRAECISDSHSLVSATDVDRKIAAAIRFHRSKGLWFSERTFQFTLTQGVGNYSPGNGPPPDLSEIVGKTLWIIIGGDNSSRWPVSRVTSTDFDRLRIAGPANQSQPSWWDWWGNQLRLYPTPISSTDILEGRYVIDIDSPVVKYEAGAFVFYDTTGTRKLSSAELDNWEGDWLSPTGAYHMVKARTLHSLYKEVLGDADRANDQLTAWLELVGVLEEEHDAKTAGATSISGCILDGDIWEGIW